MSLQIFRSADRSRGKSERVAVVLEGHVQANITRPDVVDRHGDSAKGRGPSRLVIASRYARPIDQSVMDVDLDGELRVAGIESLQGNLQLIRARVGQHGRYFQA